MINEPKNRNQSQAPGSKMPPDPGDTAAVAFTRQRLQDGLSPRKGNCGAQRAGHDTPGQRRASRALAPAFPCCLASDLEQASRARPLCATPPKAGVSAPRGAGGLWGTVPTSPLQGRLQPWKQAALTLEVSPA